MLCRATPQAFTVTALGAGLVTDEESCEVSQHGWYYCRQGPKVPLLVLISGLGGNSQSWPRDFLDAVHKFGGTLTYNRRGYPPSPRLGAGPVLASAAAADLRQLLDDLHLERSVELVAHSLGGLYANYFARRHPEKVRALILIDPASPAEIPGDPRFKSRGRWTPGSPEEHEDAGVDDSIIETRNVAPFPNVPVLVLAATNHQSPPDVERTWFEIHQRTAATSPRGRLIVASGAGHYIQAERPLWTAAMIEGFLASLRDPGDQARVIPDAR